MCQTFYQQTWCLLHNYNLNIYDDSYGDNKELGALG